MIAVTKERGLAWTSVSATRFLLHSMVPPLDKALARIERRRFLTGEGLVSSSSHSLSENREFWDSFDWSGAGKEWTFDAKRYGGLDPESWKTSLVENSMRKHIEEGSTVVEVGPGDGRWTEELLKIAGRVLLVDISKTVLALCQARFDDQDRLAYHLTDDLSLRDIADDSVDFVWSYDVFVHINPTDIETYIKTFRRILRPGGRAIIHHSGTYAGEDEQHLRRTVYRSHMDGKFFAVLLERNGLRLLDQDGSLVHYKGDLITVFEKPL